jgi:uncharacterized membrane protein
MKNLFSTTAFLLVLSFSSAALANADGQGKMGKDGTPSYLEQTIANLPEQDAVQFRDTMKQAHEKNMAIADKVHELHDDLDEIMAADTFDKKAFLAKSDKLREVYEQMRANTDEAFASASAQLSQEERKTLAAAMAYPHKKHTASKNAQ